MPPIFGILHTRLQQPDQGMISRMNDAARYVVHRSIISREIPGGYVAAACRADLPMDQKTVPVVDQGQYLIAADASLYRRRELLDLIGNSGGSYPEGDAALILMAYLKWGENCLQYLYGDFAFVVYNKQTGEIFCGRDPLGIRPLFYSRHDQSFVFSSELRYVLASLPAKPALSREYLLDTLMTVKTDKDLSPFEGIYRLKPGHYLYYSHDALHVSQYWQADPHRKTRLNNEHEYKELFREKLVNAVYVRCAGVHNLGSELSGGLDSSAICGIAAKYASQEKIPFTAFSNIFTADTGMEFKDEQEFIDAMLEFKSMDWKSVDRLIMSIPELLKYSLGIQGCFIQQNFNIFNKGIYEAAGGKRIEVLLSGFGGDELVSARTSLSWNELISERQWGVMADELFYKGITPKSLLKPGLLAARYLYSLIYQTKYRAGVFTPELLDRRYANLPIKRAFAEQNQLRQHLGNKFNQPWHKTLAQRQYARIMQNHLPQRMEYCYTAAAQYGMEYRYPLLDTDLIETCLAFPPWMKQHHGTNRYIFRQAIQGFVPEKIRQRDDKSGTTIPQTFYSLVNERESIMDLINSCSGNEYLNEIFDISRFSEWYDRLIKREKEEMNYLMPGAFYNYLMILLYYR